MDSSSMYSVRDTVELIDRAISLTGDLDIFVIVHSSPCSSYGVLGRIIVKQQSDGAMAAMTLNGIGPKKPIAATLNSEDIMSCKEDIYDIIIQMIYQLKEALVDTWHIELPEKSEAKYADVRKAFSRQDLSIQQILFSKRSKTTKEPGPRG